MPALYVKKDNKLEPISAGGGSVEVTKEKVVNALGYEPADKNDIMTKQAVIDLFKDDVEFEDMLD